MDAWIPLSWSHEVSYIGLMMLESSIYAARIMILEVRLVIALIRRCSIIAGSLLRMSPVFPRTYSRASYTLSVTLDQWLIDPDQFSYEVIQAILIRLRLKASWIAGLASIGLI